MSERPPGDQATVTVLVAVEPELAFAVFTEEIDLWWRRGAAFRPLGRRVGTLHLEPGEGGRLFESCDDDSGQALIEVGRVTAWQPPGRLVFEWRNVNFAPGETTEVEVEFAPAPGGATRVTLQHRGWAALRPDHPARHGRVGPAMSRMIGMWWGQLLGSLREHVATRR